MPSTVHPQTPALLKKLPRRQVIQRGAALLGAISAPWGLTSANTSEYVVGQVLPLSGVLRQTGEDLVAGVALAFDAVNAQGGVNGRKIRHVVVDDGYDIEKTVQRTSELIQKENPIALVGMVGTGNIAALLSRDVLAKADIALVGPYTGGVSLRQPYSPHIFHIRASYVDEGRAMVKSFLALGFKRIAVFYQDDAFGQSGRQGVEEALKAEGLQVAAAAAYPKNTDQVTNAVQAILASNAQAVCMFSVSRSSAEFIKQYRAAHGQAQLFNISVINVAQVVDLAGADTVRGLGVTQVMPYPHQPRIPLVAAYQAQIKASKQADRKPDYTSFEGYVAARVVIEGLKRLGKNTSRKDMLAALENCGRLDLGGFALTFGPNQREGSHFVETTALDAYGRLVK